MSRKIMRAAPPAIPRSRTSHTLEEFSQMTETHCPHPRKTDATTGTPHRFTHATPHEFRRVGCGAFRRCAYSRRYGSPFPPSLVELSRVRICFRNRRLYANVLSTWDQQGKTLGADHGGPRPRVCSCGSQRRARRRLQTETGRGEVVWNVQLYGSHAHLRLSLPPHSGRSA